MQNIKPVLDGKKVAVFGLGDSVSYSENYADATGEVRQSRVCDIRHSFVTSFSVNNINSHHIYSFMTSLKVLVAKCSATQAPKATFMMHPNLNEETNSLGFYWMQ